MRKRSSLLVLAICLILIQCGEIHGWGITYTHPALTQNAEEGSQLAAYCDKLLIDGELTGDFSSSDAITGRMEEAKEPLTKTKTVSEWIRAGCKIEDTRLKVESRSAHHFHDPLRNAGLDNTKAPPGIRAWYVRGQILNRYEAGTVNFNLTGHSASLWARKYLPCHNWHSWQITRAALYVGLTKPKKTERDEYLAFAFMSLGHALHMIQDVGVPPHARNDWLTSHNRRVRWAWPVEDMGGNPFEEWVERRIGDSSEGAESEGGLVLPDDSEGNDWVEGGSEAIYFPNLADYWDAEQYTADNYGSFTGEAPPNTWGLSERTNYQFLSNTTIFLEDPKGLNGKNRPSPALAKWGDRTEGVIRIRDPGGYDFAEAFTKLKHNQEVIQLWTGI